MKLTFLGAAGTVTGSKFLVETAGRRLFVDCGLFQGPRRLRERNWAPLPIEPCEVDTVVLTHAHLDHSGYLPRLVKDGFAGAVLCTPATHDLCGILLPDSGHLAEREAEFLNRRKLSRHAPALPLYTEKDARRALESFLPVPFDEQRQIAPGLVVGFRHAGHILGAAIVTLKAEGKRIVFSGDLGRYASATLPDPAPVDAADTVVVESTYGNRAHSPLDIEDELTKVIMRTIGRGGTVLIPAFAVGRTQTLFYHLERMRRLGRIPANLPIFLDSPMAIDASDIFCRNLADHKLTTKQCADLCAIATYTRAVEDSKALDADLMPKIIISASGMATG
ncbi:MAG TPA: MBL fold metallo-hydrolase, partial [Sphingomonadales bacterium]|nr:MBL fold metallo-hydrolase [Sphingomonadales bacterium]